MKEYSPALILDLSATGISVARILASHHVEVFGADTWSQSIGRYSKHVKRPSFGYQIDGNGFMEKLIDFSEKCSKKPVLIPCSDTFIELVSNNFDTLSKHFLMQSSLSPDVSRHFLNKRMFYKMCDSYGVAYPKTIFISGEEKADEIITEMRFPLILKPDLIHKWKRYLSGNKVMVIEDERKLKQVFKAHKLILSNSTIQEVIPGREDQIFIFKGYYDDSCNLRAYFTGRKIRQYPPNFGSGSLAESIRNDDVLKLSKEFLEKFEFKGLCGTEYKYDSRDGCYKMIEINIRPQLWEDLTRIAGCEIVWTMYCDLTGLDVQEMTPQKNGIKWCYLERDLPSSLWFLWRGELSIKKWLASYKNVKSDAIIDFSDWKLICAIPAHALGQFYRYKIKSYFK